MSLCFFLYFAIASWILAETKKYCCFRRSSFPDILVVIGIKNLYNILCQVFLLYCFLIITLVKGIQNQNSSIASASQIRRVFTILLPISHDRNIIRNRLDCLIAFLDKIILSVLINSTSYITAKLALSLHTPDGEAQMDCHLQASYPEPLPDNRP